MPVTSKSLRKDSILLYNLLITVKLLIAQKWRSEEVSNIHEWRVKCQYMLLMRKLTEIRQGLLEKN